MSYLLHLAYSLDNIDDAARRFWEALQGYYVFAFNGDMGAGKTTFIHRLCDHLQVADAVSSPTFALINEYHFEAGRQDKTIYHMDWYRLRNTAEAINAGLEDCMEQGHMGAAYCFIEWPEKARDLLRPPYLWITITATSPTERIMDVALNG